MAWNPSQRAAGPAVSGRNGPEVFAPSTPGGVDSATNGGAVTGGAPEPTGSPTPVPPAFPIGPLPVDPSAVVHPRAPLSPALAPYARPASPAAPAHPAGARARLATGPMAGWGNTSLGMDAATAAGLSYLGWWLTGLIIYFGERENRFVRFHAFQSIVYTSVLTVFSVIAYVVSSLLLDVFAITHNPFWATLARALALVVFVAVFFAWFAPVVIAWTGHLLRIPFIAPYADRYAAPLESVADRHDGR